MDLFDLQAFLLMLSPFFDRRLRGFRTSDIDHVLLLFVIPHAKAFLINVLDLEELTSSLFFSHDLCSVVLDKLFAFINKAEAKLDYHSSIGK